MPGVERYPAAGEPPKRTAPQAKLFGRTEEIQHLRDFVAGVARGGRVLIVQGEIGMGKTRLLELAAQYAADAGFRVAWTAGVHSESSTAFSCLGRLLFQLRDQVNGLSQTQRDVLEATLEMRPGPLPDNRTIATALHSLLVRTAAERPLLLVVDDLHLADRDSTTVLEFAARRLTATQVSLVASAHAGDSYSCEETDISLLQLPALTESAARSLLRSHVPDLADQPRRRLLAEAGGNPLLLLELLRPLTDRQRHCLDALPLSLSLSEALRARLLRGVDSLSLAERQTLLLAALERSGRAEVVAAAASAAGLAPGLADLQSAEALKLLKVSVLTKRIVFWHPLVRRAVAESAAGSERFSAHRTLAAELANEPDLQASHLAETALQVDEPLAATLECAAHRMLSRGDITEAVRALVRASDLSPSSRARSRRLAEAAYVALERSGDLMTGSYLLDRAQVMRAGDEVPRYASLAAAHILLNSGGDIDTAHQLVLRSVEIGPRGQVADPEMMEAVHLLTLLCWLGGRDELWTQLESATSGLGLPTSTLLLIQGLVSSSPEKAGTLAGREFGRLTGQAGVAIDPDRTVRLGLASIHLDRTAELRGANWQLVRQAHKHGGTQRRLYALMGLCVDEFSRGRWSETAKLADEGEAICAEFGNTLVSWFFRHYQALLAAARGDRTTTEELSEQITQWATPRGAKGPARYALQARALAALTDGDFEAAYQHATSISPAGIVPAHVPQALWVCLDLVEAAVRTNRMAQAREHVRVLHSVNAAELSPRLALIVGAATALCAEDSESFAKFSALLAGENTAVWPFELARSRLLYGERLRRARSTSEARAQLLLAEEAFRRLGARPWAERAAKELRATGLSVPRAVGHGGCEELTPQQREIAKLAAAGMSNKQIAERLSLSHRTVGSHLYQIFPKLGIVSRIELRNALTDQNL